MSEHKHTNSRPHSHEAEHCLGQASTASELNEQVPSDKSWINDKEFEALVEALGRGQGSFTGEEMGQVLEWMSNAKLRYILMQMIVQGRGTLSVRTDGELVFGAVREGDAGPGELNKMEQKAKTEARRIIREDGEDLLAEIARQQGWNTSQTGGADGMDKASNGNEFAREARRRLSSLQRTKGAVRKLTK